MNNLPVIDLCIIVLYLAGMVWIGIYFSRQNKNAEQFSIASGKIPGWAIGLSIYATFLSSNTFLGVPGKAFGSNWNSFVFSLSMPFAAWFASKYFVPFYRGTHQVSAYTHLENRFGPWARTYAVSCFLLTQFARMGTIFFGMALSVNALTGLSMSLIMMVMGICIIVYTVMGGMKAVIWTEVVQGIIKTLGALLILFLVVKEIPGGTDKIISIAKEKNKFSLGTASFDLTTSGFWVIFLYGFFINLNNFGMDQNYVQRYHTAASNRQASKSIWFCVALYVPVSLLFFIIGTSLFAYYEVHPSLVDTIRMQVAVEKLGTSASTASLHQYASGLQPADYGDKVLPNFMATKVPTGLLGILVAAILSAAMSTISSSMNASATVFCADIYKKYVNKTLEGKAYLRLLHVVTVLAGIIGLVAGIAMIGSKSILDTWWELSGVFAGGMLGLFLLGLISRRATSHEAITAVIIGLIVVIWMSFSDRLTGEYARLRSPLHKNMIIVVATLTIFLVGLLIAAIRRRKLIVYDRNLVSAMVQTEN
jgi:SSS family solute:Na+ symporter